MTEGTTRREALNRVATAVAAAVLAVGALGYYAWANDQSWNLPAVCFRELGFPVDDWFTRHSIASNVHVGFNALLTSLRMVVPSLDWRMLLLHTGLTAFLAWVVLEASREFGVRAPHALPLIALVLLGASVGDGVGGGTLWEIYLLPRQSAYALLVLTLVYHRRGRPVAAGIALGIAGLLHASAGVTGLVFMALLITVMPTRNRWRELAATVGIGLVLALPVLIAIISAQLAQSLQDTRHVFDIYAFRMPYRIPNGWRWQHGVVFVLVNAHLALMLFRSRMPARKYLAVAAGIILTLSMAQWIGVAVFDSFFWFRTMFSDRLLAVWRVIYLLTLADSLAKLAATTPGRGWARWVGIGGTIWNRWLYAPMLAWDVFVTAVEYVNDRVGRLLRDGVFLLLPLSAGIVLFIETFPPLRNVNWHGIFGAVAFVCIVAVVTAVDRLRRTNGRALYIAAVVGVVAFAGIRLLAPHTPVYRHWRIARSDFKPTQQLVIADWARMHSPHTAQFLVPPSFWQFRLVAERPIYVDYKANGLTDRGVTEWYDRLMSPYDVRHGYVPGPADAYTLLPDHVYEWLTTRQVMMLADRSGAEYFVGRTGLPYPFRMELALPYWTLYRLPERVD